MLLEHPRHVATQAPPESVRIAADLDASGGEGAQPLLTNLLLKLVASGCALLHLGSGCRSDLKRDAGPGRQELPARPESIDRVGEILRRDRQAEKSPERLVYTRGPVNVATP